MREQLCTERSGAAPGRLRATVPGVVRLAPRGRPVAPLAVEEEVEREQEARPSGHEEREPDVGHPIEEAAPRER